MHEIGSRAERAWVAAVTAYCLAIVGGTLFRDWRRERSRIAQVVADTASDLNARADEIRERMAPARDQEQDARYDARLWGEIAAEDATNGR